MARYWAIIKLSKKLARTQLARTQLTHAPKSGMKSYHSRADEYDFDSLPPALRRKVSHFHKIVSWLCGCLDALPSGLCKNLLHSLAAVPAYTVHEKA
jgi:hypothetical protein